MDQFKTPILNINQLKLYSDKPFLIFFLREFDIVIFQLLKTLDGIDIQYELNIPIKTSLMEDLETAIKQVIKDLGVESRPKILMILDDYYLTMHRFQLKTSQLTHLQQSLDIEIDHLHEYEYGVLHGPSEVKNMSTVLVYLIKKNNLKSIEDTFLSKRLLLRRIVSRYHVFQSLFNHQVFDINPEKLTVLIDIGLNRIRLFIVLNNEIKVYRRMPLRLESSKSSAKLFQSVFSSMVSFVESSIDSYTLKHANQSIDGIFLLSDVVQIPSNLKAYKINGISLTLMPLNSDVIPKKKLKDPLAYVYVYGYFLMMFTNDKFNLIPFMKRFERFGIRLIGSVFGLVVIYLFIVNAFQYYHLNKEYASYKVNQSSKMRQQAKKKRDMVVLRDRINQQKKIIDYSDLTSKAYSTSISLDDFLYDLTSISSPDISFGVLRIRNKKVTMSGTSSSLNGNYSFYMFLQQLETFPYLGRIHYTLGLGGGLDLSSFSIEVFWEDNG